MVVVVVVVVLVKPSFYSRTTYTDVRGDDGENTKAEARGLRAQPRAARVQHTQAQAETYRANTTPGAELS